MWPNPQESADLATFTGEIFNGKFLHILCSGTYSLELKMFRSSVFIFNKSISIYLGEIIQPIFAENINWLKSQYCIRSEIPSNKFYYFF